MVGAAGTVATAALGAPGQMATVVVGTAVSAAATVSKVSLGAVTTAANLVVVGDRVARIVPSPYSATGGAATQPQGQQSRALALLPSVPTATRTSPWLPVVPAPQIGGWGRGSAAGKIATPPVGRSAEPEQGPEPEPVASRLGVIVSSVLPVTMGGRPCPPPSMYTEI